MLFFHVLPTFPVAPELAIPHLPTNCSQCVSNPAHLLICHLHAHLLPITPQPQYKYTPSQDVAQDMCLVSIVVFHSFVIDEGAKYKTDV